MKYVAFLRGINVGGNKQIPMMALKKVLQSTGLENVITLLNSGNVVFETEEKDKNALSSRIEEKLETVFKHKIHVLLRSSGEIKSLIDLDPFKGIIVNAQTRLYVTFLFDPSTGRVKSKLKIPYETPEKDFKIISVSDKGVCSVVIISEKRNTTDLMGILEKEFGKNVTTRNWNTVVKVANLL